MRSLALAFAAMTVVLSGCAMPRVQAFALYTHCGLDHTQSRRGEYWRVVGADADSRSAPEGFDDPVDRGTIVRIDDTTAFYLSESGIPLALTRVPGRPADEVPCR